MPRDRYLDITADGLNKLYFGLDTLETVARDDMHDLDLFLYGLTQSETIVDAAKEAIADAAELEESDVQLSEVAVAIPLGADTIHALLGSGFRAHDEDFAYLGQGGEGIRTQSFTFSHYKPTLAASEFSQMVLAQSDAWLDDFLRQYGNKQPAEIKQKIHRTEEATEPGVPAVETPPPAAPAAGSPAAAPAPKKTSLEGGLKLADVLEDFLG